eukprot:7391181-Prymnesium_polylepis.1
MTVSSSAQDLLARVATAAAGLEWQTFERTLANLTFTLLKAGLSVDRSPLLQAISNWAWLTRPGASRLANSIFKAASAAAQVDATSSVRILDPPMVGIEEEEEQALRTSLPLASRRSGRTWPAYRCIMSFENGKHGENRCPQICPLFYRIRSGLYCTHCMREAGFEGSPEARFMTPTTYRKALDGCPALVHMLAGARQQSAVLSLFVG